MNAEALRQHNEWKAARARLGAPVEPAMPMVRRPIARRRSSLPTAEYPSLLVAAVARFQAVPAYTEELQQRITARQIMVEVSDETGVPIEEMVGASRRYVIARARQFAMWRIRRECPHMSFPQIGRLFGGRDHTTALHAFRKMEAIHGGGALSDLYGLARAA